MSTFKLLQGCDLRIRQGKEEVTRSVHTLHSSSASLCGHISKTLRCPGSWKNWKGDDACFLSNGWPLGPHNIHYSSSCCCQTTGPPFRTFFTSWNVKRLHRTRAYSVPRFRLLLTGDPYFYAKSVKYMGYAGEAISSSGGWFWKPVFVNLVP